MPEGIEDIRCPVCASSAVRRVHDHAFAIEWTCVVCVKPFFTPLLSVVLLDRDGDRRGRLVAEIEAAGIPTIPTERMSTLEELPADVSVIADLEGAPALASQLPLGIPLIVLIDSAQQRAGAIKRTDRRGIAVNGTPAAVLELLKAIARVKAADMPMPRPMLNRRKGARDRHRTTRRDRRS